MHPSIRIAHLEAPFVYRSMAEIETARTQHTAPDLPHRHDFFTIILVKNALGSHQIDFQTFDLQDNTLYFIAPEQVHHLAVDAGTDPSGHVLMFTRDFLQQYSLGPDGLHGLELFFNCDEARPLALETEEMAVLLDISSKIADEHNTSRVYRWEILGAFLSLLLLESSRMKLEKQQHNVQLGHRASEIVRSFKNAVEQHFQEWHLVVDYAQAQHLSSNYLNEVIKSETGSSAKDWIQQRLLLEAKRLAQYSDMPAKEIAFALGYEDVAHFSKFFKNLEGRSFSEFKNGLRKTDKP
ncbi:MAG: helix-turn-helix transcriptional regulator [Saprospiraceae bacterium]|nr:helix-turn-helix transcriptional regulator [Saprospiraceae bacterium]